ncbi:MAG: ADP-glyceromanno-heptose 6-epimerase [Dongiaceae bacterium]
MIFVTGGAGFIGSNLVAALSERGRQVAVCDRFGHDAKWQNLAKRELVDVMGPEAMLAALNFHKAAIEAVIHLGAITSTSATDVDAIVANNFNLSMTMWRWCIANGKPLIYASSAATYGDGEQGFADDATPDGLARLRPRNPYGWSKHLFDRAVIRAVAERQKPPPQWVGLKFFNVYGPNEYHKGSMQSVIARNLPRLVKGEALQLFRSERAEYPDGGQRRDFIYVVDVVDVILWLLDNPKVSGLFNLGTGEARSWLDLGRAIFAAIDLPEKIEFIDLPREIAGAYQYHTQAEMSRLRKAGYDAQFTPLEAGVADYVRRYLMTTDPYR